MSQTKSLLKLMQAEKIREAEEAERDAEIYNELYQRAIYRARQSRRSARYLAFSLRKLAS